MHKACSKRTPQLCKARSKRTPQLCKETKEYVKLLIGFDVLAEELTRGLYLRRPVKPKQTVLGLLQDSYRILGRSTNDRTGTVTEVQQGETRV